VDISPQQPADGHSRWGITSNHESELRRNQLHGLEMHVRSNAVCKHLAGSEYDALTQICLTARPGAGAGLGTVAAMLASGAVASASPRPAVGATTPSQIKFVIHEPAIGSVSIASLGGAGTITSQAATGNDMIGFETSAGGFSMYAGATANTGQDLIEGTTTPGATVTGTATLSSGATMTASINGGPSVAIQNGNF
jgi:hypothetical protein